MNVTDKLTDGPTDGRIAWRGKNDDRTVFPRVERTSICV